MHPALGEAEPFALAADRAGATSVVVHRVPAALRARFLELQRGITQAAKMFAGYRKTDVYPPAEEGQDEWVVVIQFDDQSTLGGWLDSPQRALWTARFCNEIGDYRLKTLPGGFSAWFADAARGSTDPAENVLPPAWKMALGVLLGLYPTVMLLTLFVGPHTDPLGLAWAMLIGNALSVGILQWGVMPVLTLLLAPWLKAPSGKQGRVLTLGGLGLLLLALAALAAFFQQFTG